MKRISHFNIDQRISFSIFCCIIALIAVSTVMAQSTREVIDKTNTQSLGNVLNADGSIQSGVVGGFNAAGFEMKLDERGAPRFVRSQSVEPRLRDLEPPVSRTLNSMLTPTPTPITGYICRDDYDRRFYNNGTYDEDFYHY